MYEARCTCINCGSSAILRQAVQENWVRCPMDDRVAMCPDCAVKTASEAITARFIRHLATRPALRLQDRSH